MPVPAPRWDLTNVYPSLESDEFRKAFDEYRKKIADLEDYFVEVVDKTNAGTPIKTLGFSSGRAPNRSIAQF